MKRVRDHVPPDLIASVEEQRRNLLALFRALDRPYFARYSLPQAALRKLMVLDADLAEFLGVLDRRADTLRVKDVIDDTRKSLRRVPQAEGEFFDALTFAARAPLRDARQAVRATLEPADAYHAIPGIDPTA